MIGACSVTESETQCQSLFRLFTSANLSTGYNILSGIQWGLFEDRKYQLIFHCYSTHQKAHLTYVQLVFHSIVNRTSR